MGKNVKLILGIFFTVAASILIVCVFTLDDVFGRLALPCITVGLPLLFDYFMKKRGSELTIPILAFVFSVSCVPLWLLGELFAYGALRNIGVANLFFISALLYPVIGMIMGGCALSLAQGTRSKVKIGLSISAIVFPVLVVIVLIILFSTGVLVISLM